MPFAARIKRRRKLCGNPLLWNVPSVQVNQRAGLNKCLISGQSSLVVMHTFPTDPIYRGFSN